MILNGLLTAVRNKFLSVEPGSPSINSTSSPSSTTSSMCSCDCAIASTSADVHCQMPSSMGGIKKIVANFATAYDFDEEDEEPEPRRRSSTSARLSRIERIVGLCSF